MDFQTACSVLDVPITSTPEEIKKAYKSLSKKYHPDICKEPDAEDKFKKINQAYKVASEGEEEQTSSFPQDFSSFFNRQRQQVFHQPEHIQLSTTISFKESILGCKKEISFSRKIKCQECSGEGQVRVHNNCKKCNGKGQTTGRAGNMVYIKTCDSCGGRANTISCTTCSSQGTLNTDVSLSVSIPGGVETFNILRLNGMGNFAGSFGPMDQHTDVHLQLNVDPEEGLSLDGLNVVSYLNISLLEALRGCQKSVKTILGEHDIIIPQLSKNKEEVIIPHLGVNKVGNQRVILNVIYPENTELLIKVLGESN